jgi:hypothetical protein
LYALTPDQITKSVGDDSEGQFAADELDSVAEEDDIIRFAEPFYCLSDETGLANSCFTTHQHDRRLAHTRPGDLTLKLSQLLVTRDETRLMHITHLPKDDATTGHCHAPLCTVPTAERSTRETMWTHQACVRLRTVSVASAAFSRDVWAAVKSRPVIEQAKAF